MVRRIVYTATILGLIALGVVARKQISSGIDSATTPDALTPTVVVESDLPSSGSPSVSPAKETAKMREPQSSSPAASGQSFSESSSAHALTLQQANSGESELAAGAGSNNSAAVIGRPFPVSESVEAECKRRRIKSFGCRDVPEALAQLASEPRDEVWATAMEEKIRDYLLTKEPGTQPIRALECRTSLCAVECISGYHGACNLEYEFTRVIGLLGHGSMQGYETSATETMVTVTVLTYIRREPIL